MNVSLFVPVSSVVVTVSVTEPGAGGVPLSVSVEDGPAGRLSQLGKTGETDQVVKPEAPASQNNAE
jgi:hypothetical protein